MYDKSSWMFSLHNLFKVRDGLSSEQSYRRIFDNIVEFDEMFDEGASAQDAYEGFYEYEEKC